MANETVKAANDPERTMADASTNWGSLTEFIHIRKQAKLGQSRKALQDMSSGVYSQSQLAAGKEYRRVTKQPSVAATDQQLSAPARSPSGMLGKSLVKHIASSALLSFGSGSNATTQDKRFG